MDELSERNYVAIDNFLKEDDYRLTRHFFLDHLHEFRPAGIGTSAQNQVLRSVRGDVTYWLDSQRDLTLQPFWELVNETITVFNRYCYLSLSGFEFHMAHYAPGRGYEKHIDQFGLRNNRMISMVIYFNEGWKCGDGGELELEDSTGKSYVITPLRNRCVMFKSADVPHAVLEARKSRYSLTGWFLYHPVKLGGVLS